MDQNLRAAWTQIVSGEDYDEHMAAVGQAQAGAALTAEFLQKTALRVGSRVVIAGAGSTSPGGLRRHYSGEPSRHDDGRHAGAANTALTGRGR